tara:strand:- start:275 stop:400 length:126 start_codon:yes stop_codon:yes gene_type:complete
MSVDEDCTVDLGMGCDRSIIMNYGEDVFKLLIIEDFVLFLS